MACGLPVLSSDLPPFPEIMKSDYGYMVNRKDKKAIHDCLNSLLNDTELLRTKSYAARKASEKFSWDRIVNQYIELVK